MYKFIAKLAFILIGFYLLAQVPFFQPYVQSLKDSFNEKIGNIKAEVTRIQGEVKEVKDKVDETQQKITEVKDKVTEVKEGVENTLSNVKEVTNAVDKALKDSDSD